MKQPAATAAASGTEAKTARTRPRRAATASPRTVQRLLDAWFAARGWRPFPFQREVWQALATGDSGLLHASTGSGKTYALWFGALAAAGGIGMVETTSAADAQADGGSSIGSTDETPKRDAKRASARRRANAPPLTVLWITPMRALAADTAQALAEPLAALGSHWTVGLRTADTSAAERARQTRRAPTALVTTPESLSLALSREHAAEELAHVRIVIVDEWHELLASKRGVQTQLALARLTAFNPGLQIWGLSATLGNLDTAMDALLRPATTPRRLVQGIQPKKLEIDTLIPERIERFPWAGHLNTQLVGRLAAELDHCTSALVFTNTRAQAEIWYQSLLDARPDFAGVMALHHGSLDKSVREWVEDGLKRGTLRVVVCTSSLDLGVDFSPVDRVFQIGSPKGVARLLQRAGRSGHSPGRASRVTVVPTLALELIEAAAARHAVRAGHIEARRPPRRPLDVLIQHLATLALGGGFEERATLAEVRRCWSYQDLSEADFAWAIRFLSDGGAALSAYPDYKRIVRDADGRWRMPRTDLARRHRLNIGTIVSDATIELVWMTGGRIGRIEENFGARLKPGDVFTFAGRSLEFVRLREMTAYVRKASKKSGFTPRWQGARMPLSTELAEATLALIDAYARAPADGVNAHIATAENAVAATAGRRTRPRKTVKAAAATQPSTETTSTVQPAAHAPGDAASATPSDPEISAVAPLLALQQRQSVLPAFGRLVVELVDSREGHHLFCYPFAGRTAHLGLASLLAWRAARDAPNTFSIAINDYGFELLSAVAIDWPALIRSGLFGMQNLADDIVASLNASELAKRRFREIARVAGLVAQRYPGLGKSQRQLQVSAGLIYDVFRQHDAGNRLLTQADEEVLFDELDMDKLRAALVTINAGVIDIVHAPRPTPFAFPLMVARLRERISNEKLSDRVQRMLAALEKAADSTNAARRSAAVRETVRPTEGVVSPCDAEDDS
ncbi:DEAD/DEAH box helicase [Chitinasiproducens palmae]|uniref:ATP-dependent helicase Lhr and Lhr-like helicase n=1 Tax=Chitinasiproducens palmae TaxID=1770053 RepID=A0A1H2PSI5_9BURK|nr:DEAD/DEAH box helicase [Chitinasiproducens palmae]SDV49104.1 ATP-dependent helicase Lhr and Lhr-like helicase [Chitinasiproducens palmae]